VCSDAIRSSALAASVDRRLSLRDEMSEVAWRR
jgi:hypothetical protein